MNKHQLEETAAMRREERSGSAKPRRSAMNAGGRSRAALFMAGLSAAAVSGCGSSSSPITPRKTSAPAIATAANQRLEHHFADCIERAGWRVSTAADRDAASELMTKQPGLLKMIGIRSATGAAASVGFFTSPRNAELAGMKVGRAVPGHGHATAPQGIAIGWINFSGKARVDESLTNCAGPSSG
jgi:hypothetical protein